MKLYAVRMEPFYIEAEDKEDAKQQALSMIEEGGWELDITEFEVEETK